MVAAKRAIPAKAELTKSRKLMQEVYAKQLADKSPAGRRQLAETLIADATKYASANPTDGYVILTGAIQASRESANLKLCAKATDALAEVFDVDELAVKGDAAAETRYSLLPAAELPDNINLALELVDRLMSAEDFVTANKICAALQTPAANNASLRAITAAKTRDVTVLRAARDRVQPALDRLKASPDDPAANLAVGSYFCFNRNNWETGLPLLAKGSNVTFKQLASAELGVSKDLDKLILLGDGWWAEIDKQPPASQQALRDHALSFYQRALSGSELTGLNRARIEKRVASAPKPGTPAATAKVDAPMDHAAKLRWINNSFQPIKGRVLDVLLRMTKSDTARGADGALDLAANSRLTTMDAYHSPIIIRAIVMPNDQEMTISYGSKLLVLNPDTSRPQSPFAGVGKPITASVPAKTWVGVEFIIRINEIYILVDGEEKYHAQGEFANANDYFYITAPNGGARVGAVTAAFPR